MGVWVNPQLMPLLSGVLAILINLYDLVGNEIVVCVGFLVGY